MMGFGGSRVELYFGQVDLVVQRWGRCEWSICGFSSYGHHGTGIRVSEPREFESAMLVWLARRQRSKVLWNGVQLAPWHRRSLRPPLK
jgi:hypothetical protein